MELPSQEFFEALTSTEIASTNLIISDISDYFALRNNPVTIAGVGSVLWTKGNDIDLAVIGFKYGQINHHGFSAVERFTETLHDYFKHFSLRMRAKDQLGREKDLLPSKHRFSQGSGPFEGLNDFVEVNGLEAHTQIESFNLHNSKGLQINYAGQRPIDVQFVFNRTFEEWRVDQAIGFGNKQPAPYALLYQK